MYLKVKDLKEALKNVPDNCEVRYQRIEDIYFEKYGWDKIVKKLPFGDEIYYDKDDYSQYIEVFSACKHPDADVFVLNAHF